MKRFIDPKIALRTICGLKSQDSLENPLEIADYAFCSH
jgi:hypothetical protein